MGGRFSILGAGAQGMGAAVVRHLLFSQRLGVGQMAPRQKRAALHGNALIVVDDLIWGVVGRFWKCADVHGPLGGVILVKAGGPRYHDFDMIEPLIVLYPVCKILFP